MQKINKKQEHQYKLESLIKPTFEFSKQEFESKISILSSFSLSIGGFICWLYFSGIKYLPELDIQSLLSIVVGSSIVGFILFFTPPYFIIFPGVVWKYLTEKDNSLELIFSNVLDHELTPKINSAHKKIFISRPKSSNFKILFFFVWTFFGDLFLISSLVSYEFIYGKIFLFIFISMFLLVFYLVIRIEKFYWSRLLVNIYKSVKIWFYSLYSFFAYIISWLFLIQFFLGPQKLSCGYYKIFEEKIIAFIIVFALFMLVMLVSFLAISDKSKYSWNSYLISLLFFVFLIFYANELEPIPDRVMKIYGWGNIKNATILVNYTGCKAAENMGIKLEKKCSNQNLLYKINGVNILSSIGKNYYLNFPEYYPQGDLESIKFTLPSSSVISWSRQNIDLNLPSEKQNNCKDL